MYKYVLTERNINMIKGLIGKFIDSVCKDGAASVYWSNSKKQDETADLSCCILINNMKFSYRKYESGLNFPFYKYINIDKDLALSISIGQRIFIDSNEIIVQFNEQYLHIRRDKRMKELLWYCNQLRLDDACNVITMNRLLFAIMTLNNQGHSGFSYGYLKSYIKYIYQEKGTVEENSKKIISILNDMIIKMKKDVSNTEEDIYWQQLMNNNIIEIIKTFIIPLYVDEHYNEKDKKEIIRKFCRLSDHKPLVPLTGEDDEWKHESFDSSTEQNVFCSAVFRKQGDNSTAVYIDGRIFSDDGGRTWFRKGGNSNPQLNSEINITFPFEVPDEPEKIYLNGEGSTEILDKDDPRIQELRNK